MCLAKPLLSWSRAKYALKPLIHAKVSFDSQMISFGEPRKSREHQKAIFLWIRGTLATIRKTVNEVELSTS